jgi:hypothetical protein
METKMKLIIKLSVLLLLFSFATQFTYAKEKEGDKKSLNKTLGLPNSTKFNINNISTIFYSNGKSDEFGSNAGYIYPILSGKSANFVSGLMWGGYVGAPDVKANLKVGGSLYRQGLTVGRIIGTGPGAVADNPNNANVRIYRVRRDYKTGSLATEVLDDAKSEAAVRAQYETDWNEWPVAWGAPFEDINKNGTYEPAIDIPGVPGADQTIWFVANDLSQTVSSQFYGTTPMGVEQQCTIWGYKQAGALGNMFFKKYTIINKNAEKKDFTKMYVSYVTDTDIGGGAYDYSGCDTTLSLFWTYSAIPDNAQYGLTPPATGFDFFQGPKVRGTATDTAVYNGKYLPGWKNLPMSAHFIFINGDAVWGDPDQNSAAGTGQLYNLFEGKIATTGIPFVDYVTKKTTKFALAGDPFTRTGWVDGLLHPAGDRRNGGVAGPFTLAYGDTQEVVIAEMSAGATPGVDNIGALKLLYEYDKTAQIAYNRLFKLPQPAPNPKLTATAYDKKILLNWGSDPTAVNETESYDVFGYKFQGYNLYQLPSNSASISDGILLKTYDIVDGVTSIIDKTTDSKSGAIIDFVAANGGDTGIQRTFEVTTDKLSGAPELHNGSKYYFAVSSYSYNPEPPFGAKVLDNPLAIITVTPEALKPGVILNSKAGDPITVTRTGGASDGVVAVSVIDPLKVTGASYKIKLVADASDNVTWSVLRRDTTILSKQADFAGHTVYVDGMLIGITGPDYFGVSWSSTGTRTLSGDPANGGDLMFGSAFLGKNFWGETTVKPADLRSVHVDAFKIASYTDSDGNGKYTPGEKYVVDPAKGQLANMYSVWGTGKWLSTSLIPFKFFSIEPNGTKRQLSVIVRDRNKSGQWDPNTGATPYEYIWVLNTTYDPTGKDWNPTTGGRDFGAEILANGGPVLWTFWWYPRGTAEQFSTDFTMDFVAPKLFTAADAFSFSAPTVGYDLNKAKDDVALINVFPNPYYGVNQQELTKYSRFVTFSHLPAKATMRIFNLAGQLVRTIVKDDANAQFQRWDLLNENLLPVGSGLYIVHIDMPDLGKTKILKVAIIQEQQILDIF